MSDKKEPLLECPFCGGNGIFQFVSFSDGHQEGDPRYIKCVDCHSRCALWDHDKDAITAWNRRPQKSPCDDARTVALERVAEAAKYLEGCPVYCDPACKPAVATVSVMLAQWHILIAALAALDKEAA